MSVEAQTSVDLKQVFSLAVDLHTQGLFDRAAHLYEKILAAFPNNSDALHLLGLSYLQRNDSEKAIELIKKAIEINPSSPEYFNHLAASFQAAGRNEDILPTLESGLAIAPDCPDLLESLANQYLMAGDSHRALALLEKAFRQAPDSSSLALSLARVYARKGEAMAALSSLQQALSFGAIDIEVCIEVAEGLAAVGYRSESQALLETTIAAVPLDCRPCRSLAKLMLACGQHDDALIILLEAIARQGETLPLLSDLGSAYLQRGLFNSAIGTYKDALLAAPDEVSLLNSLAFCLFASGFFEESEKICSRLIELAPLDHSGYFFQGQIYQEQNKHEDALQSLHRAQRLLNDRILEFDRKGRATDRLTIQEMTLRLDYLLSLTSVTNQMFLSHVHFAHAGQIKNSVDECVLILKAMAEWVGLFSKRISHINPLMAQKIAEDLIDKQTQLAHIFYNQGLGLIRRELPAIALHALRASIALAEDNLTFLHGVGSILTQIGQIEEAKTLFNRILEQDPENLSALNSLGLAHLLAHQPQQAEEWLTKAYSLNRKDLAIRLHLAWSKHEGGKLSEAKILLDELVAECPEMDPAWSNLGIVTQETGDFERAVECSRKVLTLQPHRSGSHSAFLFGFQYVPYITVDDIKKELMEWGKMHAAPHYHKAKPLDNDPDPDRKLRIGFVSADMKGHSATYFTAHLFRNLDRSQFEIYSYAQVSSPDSWTDFYLSQSDHFFLSTSYNDNQLADLIRRHRIDILIDLSGHTAGCRLLVFARRPAPVQVAWIGIGNTTGVLTMDYFLTDWHFVPQGYEHLFCEKVWRLPHNLYCYEALNFMPDVGPLPALRNGYLTFGSFSRAVRFNHDVRNAWAALLAATPNSRLFLNTRAFVDPPFREAMFCYFERHGIDRDRLRFEFVTPTQASWAAYNEVDIALDPFPHNAGLTTCEALWMGVPVLTMLHRPPQGRYGASLLTAAGLPEFIAKDPQDLAAIGSSWNDRIGELAEMRKGLREKLKQSRLCDSVAYARDFEKALRGMWQEWCKNPTSSFPNETNHDQL